MSSPIPSIKQSVLVHNKRDLRVQGAGIVENDDRITIEDEQGNKKEYAVEALFDMNEEFYALLTSDEDRVLMRVVDGDEENQYLVGIDDPEEAASVLDAYQIALEADENEGAEGRGKES